MKWPIRLGLDTIPNTPKTKRILETAEINVLCRILYDRERSEDIKKQGEVENIGDCAYIIKKSGI